MCGRATPPSHSLTPPRPPPQKKNHYQLPTDAQWKALRFLHDRAGTRFIIGIPLARKNKALVDGFLKAARAWLPREAILGVELGNEPNYWACTGAGGWDGDDHFVPGWDAYAAYFNSVAKRASGCDALPPGARAGEDDAIIMGPGWDDTNTLHPELLDKIADNGKCYMKALTVHYYVSFWFVFCVPPPCEFGTCRLRAHRHQPQHTQHTNKNKNKQPYYRKWDFGAQALVSEDLMREGIRNLTKLMKVANKVRQGGCV